MKVRFVVLEPESKRGSYEVPLPIVVGRGTEARFRIQQDRISRKHCEIFDRDGDVYLRDLGSTNGTFLDDEQVAASARTPVPPGSVLRVGTVEIRIDYPGTGRLVRPSRREEEETVGFTPLEEDVPAPAEVASGERQPAAIAVEAVAPATEAGQAVADAAVAAEEPPAKPVPKPPKPVLKTDEQAVEPAAADESPGFPEPLPATEPGGLGDLEVEQPQEQPFTGEGLGETQPPPDGSFDFLGGQADPAPADGDQLGDFFKGLK